MRVRGEGDIATDVDVVLSSSRWMVVTSRAIGHPGACLWTAGLPVELGVESTNCQCEIVIMLGAECCGNVD